MHELLGGCVRNHVPSLASTNATNAAETLDVDFPRRLSVAETISFCQRMRCRRRCRDKAPLSACSGSCRCESLGRYSRRRTGRRKASPSASSAPASNAGRCRRLGKSPPSPAYGARSGRIPRSGCRCCSARSDGTCACFRSQCRRCSEVSGVSIDRRPADRGDARRNALSEASSIIKHFGSILSTKHGHGGSDTWQNTPSRRREKN